MRLVILFGPLLASLTTLSLMVLPASAAPIHALNDLDPRAAQFNVGGSSVGWTRGWRFRVNEPDIVISGLGIAAPTAGDFALSLFDASNGALLAQNIVSHDSTGWQWSVLSSPIAAEAGGEYVVSAYAITQEAYFFAQADFVDPGWFPTGTIEFVETRFCNDCSIDEMPYNFITVFDFQYGIVDIEYVLVPEPTSALMLGLGLVGLIRFGEASRRS